MELHIWQIILITFVAFLKAVDFNTTQLCCFNSIVWGTVTGIILGDLTTGLLVGGTIQLMSLGAVAIGGASMPDYPIAAIIATTIAITTGQGPEVGLALGIPVGMLGVQFDIVAKITNGFIARKSQKYANTGKFKKMTGILLICPMIMGLVAAIPVFISITLGKGMVEFILNVMPVWFSKGLTIAGGMLPVVGIAMLLIYMPAKKYLNYILIGFVFAAYLKLPILAVAIIGFALAFNLYKNRMKEETTVMVGGMNKDE